MWFNFQIATFYDIVKQNCFVWLILLYVFRYFDFDSARAVICRLKKIATYQLILVCTIISHTI